MRPQKEEKRQMAEDAGQLNLPPATLRPGLFSNQENKAVLEALSSGLPHVPHRLEFSHMSINGTKEPGKLSFSVRNICCPKQSCGSANKEKKIIDNE